MLYDNALLARVYALAHRVTGEPRWREVAERTLDYLLREMRAPDGGFAAAQDADSPGGEGAFFVWTVEQLPTVLARDEAQAIVLRYGMRPEGNFEGANILYVAAPMEMVAQKVGPDAGLLVASALGKLYAARSGRALPGARRQGRGVMERSRHRGIRRRGRLAGPRRLSGRGPSHGHVRIGQPDRRRPSAPGVGGGGPLPPRLPRRFRGPRIHGLLALYDATFETRWLVAARDLVDRMIALFADQNGVGLLLLGE